MSAKYVVTYDGRFPNFCCGQFRLYRDGKLVNTEIPFNSLFRCQGANTYGMYVCHTWCGDEVYYTYVDGLKQKAWIKANREWLKTFAPRRDWPAIFKAFQASDMRPSSCGGCV